MLDYEALPPRTAAALFAGLRDDARIMLRLAGAKNGTDRLLRACIADRLGLLVWAKTEDGRRARNRPQSLVELLTGDAAEHGGVKAFADGEAFEAARAKLLQEA